MRRIRSHLPTILVMIVLAPLLLQLVCVVLPGLGSYTVLSGSMEPAIQTGSLIYVYDTNDYTEGDIITFVEEGETVTHRIVDETEQGFITKGERQAPDPWRIDAHQIQGEHFVSIPLYGYLLRPFSAQGMSLYGIIAGVAILFVAGRELLALGEQEHHR